MKTPQLGKTPSMSSRPVNSPLLPATAELLSFTSASPLLHLWTLSSLGLPTLSKLTALRNSVKYLLQCHRNLAGIWNISPFFPSYLPPVACCDPAFPLSK